MIQHVTKDQLHIPMVWALTNRVTNTAANRVNMATSNSDIQKLNIFGLTGLSMAFVVVVRNVEFGPVASRLLATAIDLSSNKLPFDQQ